MTTTRRPQQDLSGLLRAWKAGDDKALDDLLPMVDGRLRRLARRRLAELDRTLEPRGRRASLDSGDVVRQALVRLARGKRDWGDQSHFFGVLAHQMRNVCRDHARDVLAVKRGGRMRRIPLDLVLHCEHPQPLGVEDLLALDAALDSLASMDARQASLVELLFFTGLSVEEAAVVLGVSESTIKREWRSARAWLRAHIEGRLRP